MRIAAIIARYLLGLQFLVSGLNGFLHFMPMPNPTGVAAQFMGAMAQSHYFVPIFALQLIGGLLLLANRYVPLALVLLGPVIINILLYHGLMDIPGIGPGVIVLVLWLLVFYNVRSVFAGVWAARVPDSSPAKG